MPQEQSQQEITSEEDLIAALTEKAFIADIRSAYRELLTLQGQTIGSKDFSTALTAVAGDLMATATIYRLDRAEEVLVPRVSVISGQLAELSNYSIRFIERWLRRLAELEAASIEALLGGFPFAETQYTPVEVDVSRRAATIPAGRSVFVPADDRQARQDLKHVLNESPTGLVKPAILPSFIEMVCMKADREALAGMVSDMIRHLTALPGRDGLIPHLVRYWFPVLGDIFAELLPEKFAVLGNEMEGHSDRAFHIFLEFLAEEASSLFRVVLVEPGTVTAASRLAAGIIEPILKAGDLGERQAGLRLVAARNPPGFKEALQTIVERIEQQYDKDINPTGMGRRTTRSYVAPATWTLINDVLNRIWPAENGSPRKATRALIYSIVEATHTRGELEFELFGSPAEKLHAERNTGIGNIGINQKGVRPEQLLVHEHIRMAVSYRSTRYQLNCALAFLEAALREVRRQSNVNDPESLRLEATIRVIHLWREEMDWRLLHGAYEKEQWRTSSITFPRFPQMKPTLPIEERVEKIAAAAQPLIDEMLESISRKPPARGSYAGGKSRRQRHETMWATPILKFMESPPRFPE
ncbi:hypothetical protein [Shinella zoogloeoides]|uniref:hypothetical protein n=1 Tax=Shinella zoogloeoides TaxID=352475 RepID=UPI001F59A0FA|nr:hypothetical protein [Shinella zoogloeoides]